MAKILLMSLGSRGDMEPFFSLGEELLDQGHKIACCMPAQFETSALELTPHFYAEDKGFIELIEGPDIKKILGQVGSGFSRLLTLIRLRSQVKSIQEQMIEDQERAVRDFNPDQIIFHIKCIYPVIWALQFKGKVSLLSPMPALLDPVEDIPHIGFGKARSKAWNLGTYKIAEYALIKQSILGYGKSFLKKHQIRLSPKALKTFYREKLPVEYAISEALFPRPNYWPDRAKITKFRERKNNSFTPTEALKKFLADNPNPVYVGFGSMVNAQPKQIALDVLAVCEKYQVPVLLNESWGGLECPDVLPQWAFKIKDVPFHFLFPLLRCVIHHGGSGTTHTAFIHKKPQAIIPHIADQFFWNTQIEKKGVGIAGFKIKKWSRERFEDLVSNLLKFEWNA
jgi:sterol 3beta-glucosyltransferase